MQFTPEEFEGILQRVLASQQPFFQGMLSQIAALESREIKRDETMNRATLALELLAQQNLPAEIRDLKLRVQTLENERQRRIGLIEAFNWVPRAIGYLTVLVVVILGWLQIKDK